MKNDLNELLKEFENLCNTEPLSSSGIRQHRGYSKIIFGNKRFGGLLNPVTVRGFDCLYSYLNRLRTDENSPFSYCRMLSKFSQATETIVDLYELLSLDGKVVTHLYIDTFHPLESVCAPFGLRLEPISELRPEELANLHKPVRLSVLNFTDDDDASK